MKLKTKWAAIVIGSMTILNAEAAPITSATASFDWNTLAVTSVDGSINWLAGTSLMILTPDISGTTTNASASANNLIFTSSAFDNDLNAASSAISSARYAQNFSVTCNDTASPCSVDFSIFYTLESTLLDPVNSLGNSFSNSNFRFGITDATGVDYALSEAFINLSSGSIYSFGTPSGSLMASLANIDNDSTFTLWADTLTEANLSASTLPTLSNATAVPEPATVWLFLSGLMTLLGVTRRNSTFSI